MSNEKFKLLTKVDEIFKYILYSNGIIIQIKENREVSLIDVS